MPNPLATGCALPDLCTRSPVLNLARARGLAGDFLARFKPPVDLS